MWAVAEVAPRHAAAAFPAGRETWLATAMGEMVSYRSNGGTSEGYLARPAGGGGPAVVVIQEWWGLVPHITSVADRFAEAGFVALAPDPYPVLPWERMSPRWSSYVGKVALIHCDEEAGAGAAPGIRQAKRAIEAAGGECLIHEYPGTGHAFFNDDRPEAYHADAAKSAWARTLELFRNRLAS